MHRASLFPLLSLPLLLASCSSDSTKIKGVPSVLPDIPVYGSASTPGHSMPHADYPFEPSTGNYNPAWAAEGGVTAGDSDGGHGSGGSSSRSRGVTKVRSSTTSSKSKSKAKPKAKPAPSRKHTVTGKDSLWSISRKYGTTVDKIKAANGLKTDMLRDGRVLIIPR
jgi:hypothetical protein